MAKFLGKLSTVRDLFSFLWERRLWWMIPLILVILVVGILVLFVGSSPLAPIIYPLF